MEFESEVEESRFQKFSGVVLRLLGSELEKPDREKLIFLHQIEALLAVKEYYCCTPIPDKPALIVAPTGAGKTGMICLLPYVLASPKTLILSPSLKITDQLEKAFGQRNDVAVESFVFQRKLIQDKRQLNQFLEIAKKIEKTESIGNMEKYNLVIVNAQKFGANSSASIFESESDEIDEETRARIQRVLNSFLAFTTLIVDEAHHFPSETWELIVKQFKGKQIIFLTATPFRGKHRQELWPNQTITYRITKRYLIKNKIIRPLECKELSCGQTDYRKIGVQIRNILNEHDQLVPGVNHKAMVLVLNTEYAKIGSEALADATYYTSDPKTERNLKCFEDFTKYKLRILFVCGRLLEGYDHHPISVCVVLRNVGVLGLFTQYVGRCTRTSSRNDPVIAQMLSHPDCKQNVLYAAYMDDY